MIPSDATQGQPSNFYFNGELMPDWGACWSLVRLPEFLSDSDSWDEDFGHRDIWITYCKIDHKGTVESSDPQRFLYVIQEVILLLLTNSDRMLGFLRESDGGPPSVHRQLVDAAFAMRESVIENRIAFWCSGDEEVRRKCLEWMERSQLPEDDHRFLEPPHAASEARSLQTLLQFQARKLHALAHEGRFDRELRKALLRI